MIDRRHFLLAAGSLLFSGRSHAISNTRAGSEAGVAADGMLSWSEFYEQMSVLADAEAAKTLGHEDIARRGIRYLQQLDTASGEFERAVEESYESGNRYWLWQRLIKDQNLNGGILTIDRDQMVQLHDHPGATGILRIISGETEVWQFDAVAVKGETAELVRVSHEVLKPGDTAVLSPDRGNIHALRAVSKECSMLDFFIPPYQWRQRSWYKPLDERWQDKKKVACRKIPQQDYMDA